MSMSRSGVLYNQFLSQADFEVLRDRAQVGLYFSTVGEIKSFVQIIHIITCPLTSYVYCWDFKDLVIRSITKYDSDTFESKQIQINWHSTFNRHCTTSCSDY